MKKHALSRLIVSGALVLAPMATWAAGSVTATEEPSIQSLSPSEVASGALTPEVKNGIRYVSGGIGVEERAWLAKHAKNFNTRLTFAVVPSGEFVSDVHVKITDKAGKPVIETTANGPQLFVQLPKGHYKIVATHDGQPVTHSIDVTGKPLQITFGFKH